MQKYHQLIVQSLRADTSILGKNYLEISLFWVMPEKGDFFFRVIFDKLDA